MSAKSTKTKAERKKESDKRYVEGHREQIRAQKREYYAKNKDRIHSNHKRYRIKNNEKLNEQKRIYYKEHIEEVKKYRLGHKDRKNELRRQRYNPRLRKEELLKQKYKISLEDYERLMVSQGGVCAICGNPESVVHQNGEVRSLSVDHNHKTEAIRGLLCGKCNRGLGYFQDDSKLLIKAIKYLKDHG
jgi:hypothetical protein